MHPVKSSTVQVKVNSKASTVPETVQKRQGYLCVPTNGSLHFSLHYPDLSCTTIDDFDMRDISKMRDFVRAPLLEPYMSVRSQVGNSFNTSASGLLDYLPGNAQKCLVLNVEPAQNSAFSRYRVCRNRLFCGTVRFPDPCPPPAVHTLQLWQFCR